MNKVNLKELPYFERLPRYALPGLQAAWDKADSRSYGTLAIYKGFCRDMDEVGIEQPSQPIMSQWIADVQAGKIARPGVPAEAGAVDAVADEGDMTTPFFTPEFPAEETADPTAALIDGMLRDAKAQLSRDFEAQAKRMVAAKLRDLASLIEGAL